MKTVKLIGAGILDEFAQSALNEATLTVQNYLSEFAIDESLLTVVNSSFGNLFNVEKLENLRRQWATSNFEGLPAIDIRPAADINGANGAFAVVTNTIYLSQDYIARNTSNPQAITNVLLEEIGHFVDTQINAIDSLGDEGAIFSALAQGVQLNEPVLQSLKIQDDTVVITLDGQVIQIEQNKHSSADQWNFILKTLRAYYNDNKGTVDAGWAHQIFNLAELSFPNRKEIGGWAGDFTRNVLGFSARAIKDEEPDTSWLDRIPPWIPIQIPTPIPGVTIPIQTGDLGAVLGGGFTHFIEHLAPAFNREIYRQLKKAYLEKINPTIEIIRSELKPTIEIIRSEHKSFFDKAVIPGFDIVASAKEISPLGRDIAQVSVPTFADLLREGAIDRALEELLRLNSNFQGNRIETDLQQQANNFSNQNLQQLLSTPSQENNSQQSQGSLTRNDLFSPAILEATSLKVNFGNQFFLPVGGQYQITVNKTGEDGNVIDLTASNTQTRYFAATGDKSISITSDGLLTVNGTDSPFASLQMPLYIIVNNGQDWGIGQFAITDIDTDGDSIVDSYERKLGLNPSVSNYSLDTDGDGLSDVLEVGFFTSPTQADIDEDGVKDGDEVISSLNPFSPEFDSTLLLDGLEKTLFAIQNALTTKVFEATGFQNITNLENFSLLSNTLKTATKFQFIENLSTQVRGKFTDKFDAAEKVSVNEIQEAFFELFEPIGLLKDSDNDKKITQEDIIYTKNGSSFKFNLKLGGISELKTSLPSEISFGLPQFGLKFNENGENVEASVALDYTFDFGFGIDTTTNEFFFDTSPNKDLSVSLKPSLPKATATLGFLQVDAKDIGSQLDFSLNLEDDNNNQLTIGELNNNSFTVTPEGSADIKLNLLSSINGSKGLPQLGANLNVNWDFVQNQAPTIAFNNVELDVGSFLSDFAGPVLEDVSKITRPIQPVIDILTKEIDLKVAKVSLLDIGKVLADEFGDEFGIGKSDVDFINSVANIVTIVNDITEFSKSNTSNTKIKLGSFTLGDEADIRKPDFLLSSVEKLNITSPDLSLAAQLAAPGNDNGKKIITSFLTIPGEGLKIPLLTEPIQAFNLLLGKDISLFTYDLPDLKFDFGYSQFFPIVGPFGVRLGGNIGAEINLAFGFDTKGFRDFSKSKDAADIFNGLYVSDRAKADGTGDDISEVKFNVGLEASAELNVGVASAGVGGGIYGSIDFNLNDPDKNGKVYFDEIEYLINKNPLYIFDTSGKVTAGLNAYFKIGFRPFQIKKRYDSPRRTLAEFNSKYDDNHDGGNGGTPQTQPILATDIGSGVLRLNIGLNAAVRTYGNIIDGDEIFRVEKSGASNNKVLISAFDTSKEYDVTNKIVANGGEKNDIIQITDSVLTSAELAGGNGDDLIMGGSGNDFLEGGSGLDLLDGGNGNDTLHSGDGEDWLIGGAGTDVLDGGLDDDTASYETATTGILLNLATGEATGDAQGDVFVSIEQHEGSSYNDTLIGDATNNILGGLDGNDNLEGREGNDFLEGGNGNDTLRGGADNDWLNGGKGADVLNGQEGYDTANYATATEGVLINLSTGEALGDALGDVLTSIEAIQGSSYEDILYGGSGADRIDGGSGDDNLVGVDGNDILLGSSGIDFLSGGNGNDYLQGDNGNDILRGGADSDKFAFATGASFNINELGVDTINDFTPGLTGDKIQLSKYTFTALNNSIFPTALNSAEFATVTNDSLAEGSDRKIVYNSVNGNLFYNPNGSTRGFADFNSDFGGRFATLTGSSTPALTSDSFEVVL